MPSIRDDSTVEAVAQAFTSNGRVKSTALQAAGYSRHYSRHGGLKLFDNVRLKQAISGIDGKTSEILDHDRAIAIDLLTSDYANLATKAGKGDIQAIQARTSIVRELNAISNLHSQTLVSKGVIAPALPAQEQEQLDSIGKTFKLRLANAGPEDAQEDAQGTNTG